MHADRALSAGVRSAPGAGDPLNGQTRGPTAIVSDGTNVYWTADAAGIVVKRAAALPPGAMTTLGPAVSTNPGYLALGGGKLWWTTGFGNADPAPHLRTANLDGTGLTTVANYQTPVSTFKGRGGVAADATTVYWASENGGVYHAAFNDPLCNEGTLTATSCKSYGSATSPYGVAVDDSFVYWTEPSSGTVKKAPKAGGQSSFVATNQDLPQAIAVLGTFVYWGNASTTGPTAGTIRRAPQVAATCDRGRVRARRRRGSARFDHRRRRRLVLDEQQRLRRRVPARQVDRGAAGGVPGARYPGQSRCHPLGD